MFHQVISTQATRVVSLKGETPIRLRVFQGVLRLGHDPTHLQQSLGGVSGGIPIGQADCVQMGGSLPMVWSGDMYAICDGVTQMVWVLEFDPAMQV